MALENCFAVVTGAGSGIGRAIALSLLQEGTTVCLVGRELAKLNAVLDYAAPTDKALAYPTDLSQNEAVYQLVKKIRSDIGAIDLLVHSAGQIAMATMAKASMVDFDQQYAVNVRAPYLLTQLFLPDLITKKGQVVFINSSAGLSAKAGVGQYAASKHALKAVADSLRDEVNAEGVRVLSVYPGRTASPMQEAIFNQEQRIYQPELLLQPEDVASVVINALKLSRTAEVTDVNVRGFRKV